MADYISILDKAVSALGNNTPDNRTIIYEKARAAIERKLRAMDPLPSEDAITRQMEQLEAAIGQVETGYAASEQQAIAPETPVEPIVPAELKTVEEVPETAQAARLTIPEGFVDEPILIDGIGDKTAQALGQAGITKISQIAAMSDAELAAVTEAIGSPGFEVTQEWKQQSLEMLGGQLPRGKTNQDRLVKFQEEKGAAQGLQVQAADPVTPTQTVAEQTAEPSTAVPDEPVVTAPVEEPAVPEQAPGGSANEIAPSSSSEEKDEDYQAFLDAFTKASPDAQVADQGSENEPSPVMPDPAAPPSVEPPKTAELPDAPVEVGSPAKAELPVAPVEVEPVPVAPNTASVAPDIDVTPNVSQKPAAPVVEDVSSPEAPTPVTPAPVASAAAAINRPVEPSTPVPPQTRQPSSPAFVSELENDFARPEARAPQRPLSGSHPALKQKKGTGGKIVTGSLWVLLLGGIAAGGYYFREPIMEYGQKGISAARELLNVSDTNQPPIKSETTSEQPSSGESSKDASRLGSGETASEPSPVPVETVEPKPEAPEETTQSETETQPVRSVDPEPATVEVEGEPVEDNATNDGSAAATDTEGQTAEETASANSDTQTAPEASTESAVLSGEQSYLYEEALGATGASRDEGNIVWSLAEEPPEDGAAPEPVIKGVLEIPSRGLTMNVSIKRNVDASLSASHLIELLFTPLAEFSGGNIDNISRFVMKANEQARGESLVGIPVRIDTGYFWIALNNLEQAQKTNMNLLESGEWVDLPVTYVTGRRGLITFEKGESGKDIFAKAFADWKNR